ncbi:MAG: ATP-binding protein [Bacteroidetes bacterium]|nr:ATP-binding protein [Bacteroidota bacterium]
MKKLDDILTKLKGYQFEFRHLTVLLIGLLAFQIVLSSLQKSSLTSFLREVQDWYQRDSAEKLANLTATSFELIIENTNIGPNITEKEKRKIIQSFNIIFNQQLLQQNVKEICLLLPNGSKIAAIDNGKALFNYLYTKGKNDYSDNDRHQNAIKLFLKQENVINASEQTHSFNTSNEYFETMVPFVPHGEYLGVLYTKNNPDFSFFTREISSSYSQASITFTSLIFLGLLSMYYISSYTVRERDKARRLFLLEHEQLLKEQINHEKESLFTKRIYHTHHKAEKIMGFIKEDLRARVNLNLEEINKRLIKYANFISRVIYDMKWYDPPSNTIRNSMFVTNLNDVIKFLVENIFSRITSKVDNIDFHLNLAEDLPGIHINEYVVWEILEPLIQNSIDHANVDRIVITIMTKYDSENRNIFLQLSDNGKGIHEDLIQQNSQGIQKIFQENSTTCPNPEGNRGYGCYIAYELAKNKCGWNIEAYNLPTGGCTFNLIIKTV